MSSYDLISIENSARLREHGSNRRGDMCLFCVYNLTFARGKYARLTCFGLVTSLSSARGRIAFQPGITRGANRLLRVRLRVDGHTTTEQSLGSVYLDI